jgi:hypothetical protein
MIGPVNVVDGELPLSMMLDELPQKRGAHISLKVGLKRLGSAGFVGTLQVRVVDSWFLSR